MPPLEVTLEGDIVRALIDRGKLSEHEAIAIAVPVGAYELECENANLDDLVGKYVRCTGTFHADTRPHASGQIYRITHWEEMSRPTE